MKKIHQMFFVHIESITQRLIIFLRRKYLSRNQFRSCRKWFVYLCFVALILILTLSLIDNRSFLLSRSRRIRRLFYRPSSTELQAISARYGKLLNRSKIGSNHPQATFQPTIHSSYPHLPIHLFTQNLTSLKNVTKLILLANAFFEEEHWGLNAMKTSSAALMTQLSCPFLSDYCDITTENSLFPQADAVVFHMRNDFDQWEAESSRRPEQRFVFTLWEPPTHTPDLTAYNRFFNWTMTYRFRSDIITTYYFANSYIHKSNAYYQLMLEENAAKNLHLGVKTIDPQLSDESLANKRLGTVAALISNCGSSSRRLQLIRYLKRHIDVKVYGGCGEKCPAGVNCREFIAKNYYFFLSFENSLCQDYTTEKFFATLEYPIVPIVYGRTNYSHLLPTSGYIDVNDFESLPSLAQHLNQTRYDKEKYLSYFTWKKDYVWGLTQFFTPFCDLCLRLHLDTTPNVIEDMEAWWKGNACDRPRKFGL